MVSTGTQKIPHSLDLVIDFVNTADLEEHTDALRTPEALGSWLENRGLLSTRDLPVSERNRAAAVRLREALRALMLANNGAEPDAVIACLADLAPLIDAWQDGATQPA